MTEAYRTFQIRTRSGQMPRACLLLPGELGDVLCAHGFPADTPARLMSMVWTGQTELEEQVGRIWRLSREGER